MLTVSFSDISDDIGVVYEVREINGKGGLKAVGRFDRTRLEKGGIPVERG